jgi:DHA1 family bicyclomycin/chloramphenicol resistance-like MFS transporter
VRMGLGLTFGSAAVRVIAHLSWSFPPIPVQQAILVVGAIGAQIAFPVLTLRMLDLFPAAKGTAASAQSFVALLITSMTLGIVAPLVLPRLEWIAWTSLAATSLASVFYYLSRKWHQAHVLPVVPDRSDAVG